MAEAAPQSSPSGAKRPVTVYVDHDTPQHQPDTFNMCPLGLQFYSQRPYEEFQLFEMQVDVPREGSDPERVTCTGAVVRCQLEPTDGRYRVWVKFVDLPEPTRERIRCTAVNGQHLCAYCENF